VTGDSSGLLAVTPHGGPDACGVGERTVVDEVHAGRAAPPMTRPQPAVDGVLTESGHPRLHEGEHAILASQELVNHVGETAVAFRWFPCPRFRRDLRR